MDELNPGRHRWQRVGKGDHCAVCGVERWTEIRPREYEAGREYQPCSGAPTHAIDDFPRTIDPDDATAAAVRGDAVGPDGKDSGAEPAAWSSTWPTEAGWYWYLYDGKATAVDLTWSDTGLVHYYGMYVMRERDRAPGLWQRIPDPELPQTTPQGAP